MRLTRLALENMPFPLHQAWVVLDICAAEGASTQVLQYFMPYCTVFGVRTQESEIEIRDCGQRYLATLPNSFRCDCVVAIAEPTQPLEALLDTIDTLAARWAVVVAPWGMAQGINWTARGYQVHHEITEEPEDGVILVAIRDREMRFEVPETPRVMIISPVRQKPAILRDFLEGLRRLDTEGFEVAYLFIDNNDDAEASQMLREFASHMRVPVHRLRLPVGEAYRRTERTHHWTESLIWRLAAIKDGALDAALRHGYDYAFLLDSDLVLHPQTLRHMVGHRRDIVCQTFWTMWKPNWPPLPNLWYADEKDLYRRRRGQELEVEEQRRRRLAFLDALAFCPGLYRLSGMGACTLLSRRALEAGVCFSEIRGCLLIGEDRHLCLRAEALGFRLFADTTLPPLHLYRESDLPRVQTYWQLVEAGLQGAELNRAMFELLTRPAEAA